MGLVGDDDFRIKVSADGAVWRDALRIDHATGRVAFPAGAAVPGGKNLVINGNFLVNQRAYVSGTALSVGAFGHDRWRAGAGGCTYAFTAGKPDNTGSITAGTLVQGIEDQFIEGGSYVLSWTGTAQARVGHSGAAASGPYAPSPIPITGAGAGQQINIEFNAGTLGKVQFEPGTAVTPFERRAGEELSCLRYFERRRVNQQSYDPAAGPFICVSIGIFPKRVVPTISFPSGTYFNGASAASTSVERRSFTLQWSTVAGGGTRIDATVDISAEV